MWRQQLSAVKASGCLFTGSSGGYNHSILTKDADSRAGQIRHTHTHTHWFQSNFRELKSQQTNSHYLLKTVGMTSRRLQQRADALATSSNRKAVWGEEKKNLSSPRASWRTSQIPIGAAVRRARSTLAPQMAFLQWDRRASCFCFVTTSIAIVASTDYYPVVGGHKMETELLVFTKLWGETITSVLQETLISFYWNLVKKLVKINTLKYRRLNIF